LCAGDRGRAGDSQMGSAKGRRRGGDRVAGGHEVVDDHHAGRSQRTDPNGAGDELPYCSNAALSGGEFRGVRSVGGQCQDRHNADSDTTPAKDAGCVPRQPMDMLAAAATGHGARGWDGHEPDRSVAELAYRRRERNGQRPGQVAPAPLLVGEQA